MKMKHKDMEEGVGRKVYNISNLFGLLVKNTEKTKKKRRKKKQNGLCSDLYIGMGGLGKVSNIA